MDCHILFSSVLLLFLMELLHHFSHRGYQQTQAVIITASPTSLAGKLGLSETDQLILETQQLSQVRSGVVYVAWVSQPIPCVLGHYSLCSFSVASN